MNVENTTNSIQSKQSHSNNFKSNNPMQLKSILPQLQIDLIQSTKGNPKQSSHIIKPNQVNPNHNFNQIQSKSIHPQTSIQLNPTSIQVNPPLQVNPIQTNHNLQSNTIKFNQIICKVEPT